MAEKINRDRDLVNKLYRMSSEQLYKAIEHDPESARICITHYDLSKRTYKGLPMALWVMAYQPQFADLAINDPKIASLSDSLGLGHTVAHEAVSISWQASHDVFKYPELLMLVDASGISVKYKALLTHVTTAEELRGEITVEGGAHQEIQEALDFYKEGRPLLKSLSGKDAVEFAYMMGRIGNAEGIKAMATGDMTLYTNAMRSYVYGRNIALQQGVMDLAEKIEKNMNVVRSVMRKGELTGTVRD